MKGNIFLYILVYFLCIDFFFNKYKPFLKKQIVIIFIKFIVVSDVPGSIINAFTTGK